MNCSIFAEITIFDKYKEYMVISDKKFVAVSYDLFVGDEGEEQELMEQARKMANAELPAYSQIAKIELVEGGFVHTPKHSIKRHLYA